MHKEDKRFKENDDMPPYLAKRINKMMLSPAEKKEKLKQHQADLEYFRSKMKKHVRQKEV